MLLIGVAGTELSAQERDWLQHDAVAGVVLFKRNFASRTQVAELSAAIRAAAPRPQLICVDQEGGRVQRFREGYSALAPLQSFGALYATDPEGALAQARAHAQLMASEVRASGVDLSFAPVVDLARGNRAIGDRAFSDDPQVVASFTRAYVQALHAAGMGATLKHFPGHGTVLEDTHVDHASDPRPLDVLLAEDLVPFVAGIDAGADAVMMAHVVYPQVAPEPIGDRAFSDDPQVVASFTRAYVQALHAAGMGATLKHFPGHGTVLEDTHVDHASDPRPLDVLLAEDLVPFVAGIDAGADAVMMAHVVYPQVAPEPAGYASRWIEQILRGQLGFRGVVFSDDIGMAASFSAGGVAGRVHAHLDAGCDVVLVCHPELVAESLQAVAGRTLNTAALIGLIGRGALGWDGLLADAPTTSLSASFGTLA